MGLSYTGSSCLLMARWPGAGACRAAGQDDAFALGGGWSWGKSSGDFSEHRCGRKGALPGRQGQAFDTGLQQSGRVVCQRDVLCAAGRRAWGRRWWAMGATSLLYFDSWLRFTGVLKRILHSHSRWSPPATRWYRPPLRALLQHLADGVGRHVGHQLGAGGAPIGRR